jgi:hypothetical protein
MMFSSPSSSGSWVMKKGERFISFHTASTSKSTLPSIAAGASAPTTGFVWEASLVGDDGLGGVGWVSAIFASLLGFVVVT